MGESPRSGRRGLPDEPCHPNAPARTVAELLHQLDDIPPERIRLVPTPGTATEADLLHVLDSENVICELVEGTLVEKTMGSNKVPRVAGFVLTFLNMYLMRHNLGIAAGPDGTLRLTSGLLRVPDVSFVSWDRLPDRKKPSGPVPTLNLDLAVEVLSKANTKKEIRRKLHEYFDSGVTLVWLIDPKKKNARVYTSIDDSMLLTEDDSLDGEKILPGFRLSLRELFDFANRGPDA